MLLLFDDDDDDQMNGENSPKMKERKKTKNIQQRIFI